MRTDHRAETSEHEDRADDRKDRPQQGRPEELSVAEAAKAGARQIADITSKISEGVVSVEPSEDGWIVEVEMLEDRHVPSSSDVLGIYEIELDLDGTLVAYRRTRRYLRGKGSAGEGA
ncbi:Gas vesicle synthesis protein GvpO [Thermomonospora echinospora]|uniref:Gas vesicle synthesis protein GvpO n=1 Tax=Thermomonospora echinospora TaxID=1992 RepID=A0A1H6CIT3_9ACTN|nr:gas vesicle protein [Thermomonospora echinospora]SEG72884.1 Gas vesicle synthesis protein GvpO [Thermomonospora echinospora]